MRNKKCTQSNWVAIARRSLCRMRLLLSVCLLAMPFSLRGQNPICPMGVYIADPSSRVGPDGRLYIYGSLDESPDYYCSRNYHVLSSDDLTHWTLHPFSFRNHEILYAPDVMEKDGTWFLYYDTPDGSEYVATGSHPAGPFSDGVRIEGPRQIDPNIFIDDDGQAYYFWGQFSAKGARMNADMKTLDLTTLTDSIVTERDHFFHEGSYVIKRGPYYYYIYADISRNHRPTSIGYAMATAPLGPYTYKGVIIDNAGCDPETWNNHGSIVEFGGQWYVLYHRSTHGCRTMRKACIEPISFRPDGTIAEVVMTSQGAGSPLAAEEWTDAARTCGLSGHVRIVQEGMREVLDESMAGDTAVWRYLDFPDNLKRVVVKARSAKGASIILRTAEGHHVATVAVPASSRWTLSSAPVAAVSGVHALVMEFQGTVTLDSFRFSR